MVAMFEGFVAVKSFSGVRRHKPVGGSKVPSTLSGNSTAAARCLRGGKRLVADIAPPLARFCSEGGRRAGGQSSAAF